MFLEQPGLYLFQYSSTLWRLFFSTEVDRSIAENVEPSVELRLREIYWTAREILRVNFVNVLTINEKLNNNQSM